MPQNTAPLIYTEEQKNTEVLRAIGVKIEELATKQKRIEELEQSTMVINRHLEDKVQEFENAKKEYEEMLLKKKDILDEKDLYDNILDNGIPLEDSQIPLPVKMKFFNFLMRQAHPQIIERDKTISEFVKKDKTVKFPKNNGLKRRLVEFLTE